MDKNLKKIFFIAQGIPPNMRGISGGDKRWLELVRYILSKKKTIYVNVFTSLGGARTLRDQKLNVYKAFVLHKSKFIGRLTFFIITFKTIFLSVKKFSQVENSIVYSAHELIFDVILALKLKIFFREKIQWIAIVHWVPPTPFWKRKNSNFFNSLFFYINQRLSMFLINKFADQILTYETNIPKLRYIKKNDKRLKIVNCGLHFNHSQKIKKKKYKKIYDAIFIGRLQTIKGIYDLIKIWSEICKTDKSKKLCIIGEGIDKDNLKKRVGLLNLDKNIFFTGYLKDSYDPLRYLAKSKIFLLPSYEEAWAIVIGEAMAMKVPVIAYDLPELKTIWHKNVKFARLGNTKMLKNSFLKLSQNKSLYDKYSSSAYKFVKKYDWAKIFEEELNLYL